MHTSPFSAYVSGSTYSSITEESLVISIPIVRKTMVIVSSKVKTTCGYHAAFEEKRISSFHYGMMGNHH